MIPRESVITTDNYIKEMNKTNAPIYDLRLKHDIETRIAIFKLFNSDDEISVSIIQRRCKKGYFTSTRVYENLLEDGLIYHKDDKFYLK